MYKDILLFTEFFIPHRKEVDGRYYQSPEFHQQIRDMIRPERSGNVVIVVPRLHGKTTAIKMYILWAICYKITDKIVYLANEWLGEKLVSDIKYELENNQRIIEVFGNIIPPNRKAEFKLLKQRARVFETTTGVTLESLTKGQRIRGKRWGILFVDDPEEDADVNTKGKVNKFRRWFFSTLYNILYPDAKVVVLGTVVSKDCLVKHLIDERKRDNIYYKAIENGRPLRPAMWPVSALKQRRKDVGIKVFNQEFFHIPIDKTSKAIEEERVLYYRDRPKVFDAIIMGVDPADKEKERNDFSGIAVRGIIGEKSYSLYTKKVKLSSKKLIAFCKLVADKFEPDAINVETNKGVRLLEALREDYSLPAGEVHQTKDKYSRLLAIAPKYENKNVYHRERGDEDLEEQITNYPDTEHDDVMDARVLTFQESNVTEFLFSTMS